MFNLVSRRFMVKLDNIFWRNFRSYSKQKGDTEKSRYFVTQLVRVSRAIGSEAGSIPAEFRKELFKRALVLFTLFFCVLHVFSRESTTLFIENAHKWVKSRPKSNDKLTLKYWVLCKIKYNDCRLTQRQRASLIIWKPSVRVRYLRHKMFIDRRLRCFLSRSSRVEYHSYKVAAKVQALSRRLWL